MTIVIYYTEDKKSFQIIKPSKEFDGNVRKLVEHVTRSNHADGEQNYWRFEIK